MWRGCGSWRREDHGDCASPVIQSATDRETVGGPMTIRCVAGTALAAAMLTLLPHEAKSQVIPLDVPAGTRLWFRIPRGYCELRASRSETEKRSWTYLERSFEGTKYKPLANLVDCAAYNARNTPRDAVNSWITVAVRIEPDGTAFVVGDGGTREGLLQYRASPSTQEEIAVSVAEIGPNEVQAAKEIGIDLSVQRTHLGMVAIDENAIYQGILSRAVRNGSHYTYTGVEGTTMVARHIISLSTDMMGESPETISRLTDFSKVLARDFVWENDPWVDWYAVLDKAIITAAVGGIATAFAALLSIIRKRSKRLS